MEGISSEVAEHHLNVSQKFTPVQQHTRTFGPKKEETINEKVKKLLRAKVIKEIYYPSWLTNMVMVLKANKKWMCVDFTNLNKTCPNDSYSLPIIDQLMDAIADMSS